MSEIQYINEITAKDLAALYASVGWNHKNDLALCQQALEKTSMVFAAYLNDVAIGVARVATDFTFFAHVIDMAVHPEFQREGVGGELISQITAFCNAQGFEHNQGEFTLFAAQEVDRFFQLFNFHLVGNGMYYRFNHLRKDRPSTIANLRKLSK